ncbi:MAG: dihydrodipicolinate synthase family protein [Thermoguttaceae bacterium]|nr:dihydrodipicolinate synthase family protein [Thermoguttaceae bacterium]MDW8080168.1 dihydrodipicolinate synthase family protein [Thermoguttaceae bacterium]
MARNWKQILQRGVVIPASPLALDENRRFDPRGQRALWHYYSDAGAGGVAVGVHTTQFAIRDPKVGLFRPLLELAREVFDQLDATRTEPLVRVAGVCGRTEQAVAEAALARDLGFHAGLLSLAAMRDASLTQLVDHCRKVGEVIPLFGFYLQPAVGGVVLPYLFWRQLAELETLVAIKIAPFNRYQTLDVVRAMVDAGRDDVALYTGNDDNIVVDLLTTYRFRRNGSPVVRRIVGGLLGHWAVWTKKAVEILARCHQVVASGGGIPPEMLTLAVEVTDMNAALFDVAHHFRGCIAGVQEVLRRQRLLRSNYCLDPEETLSPGQAEELDRVTAAYPHLVDDDFVAAHRDRWLS